MATFDYVRSRKTADRLIAKYGRAGKIRKVSAGTGGKAWDPSSQSGGNDGDYDCTLVDLDRLFVDRAGTLIEERRGRVLIAACGLKATPLAQDQIGIGGVFLPITQIVPLSPGGTV